MVGRGAVNQKGPEVAFLAALHAIQGRGQEDAGEPGDGGGRRGGDRFAAHSGRSCSKPEVRSGARKKCVGVFMPSAMQDLDGIVTVNLGAKGVIEVELVSSGEKWGRGPAKDIHSSLKAMVDSPAWHLVKALNTLVSDDGNDDHDRQLSEAAAAERGGKEMIAEASKVRNEAQAKKQLGVQHWIDDLPWEQANERLESQPTVNIEGLGRRLHRAGRQNDVAASRGGEDRHAARARHESGGRAGGVQGASGEARLRRHRSEHERRLRSDEHVGEFAADPGAGGGLQERRHRSAAVAAQCRLVSGLRLHGRAAQTRRRTFRSRSRQRRACAGRVLHHRVGEPEGPGIRRRGDVVRRVSLRAGEVTIPSRSGSCVGCVAISKTLQATRLLATATLALRLICVPARATETGQVFFVSSACSRNCCFIDARDFGFGL